MYSESLQALNKPSDEYTKTQTIDPMQPQRTRQVWENRPGQHRPKPRPPTGGVCAAGCAAGNEASPTSLTCDELRVVDGAAVVDVSLGPAATKAEAEAAAEPAAARFTRLQLAIALPSLVASPTHPGKGPSRA